MTEFLIWAVSFIAILGVIVWFDRRSDAKDKALWAEFNQATSDLVKALEGASKAIGELGRRDDR